LSGVPDTHLKVFHPNSIVKFRGRRGWSVKACADAVGCDEWSVRNLEMGHTNLHDKYIEMFCSAFHCSRAQLLAPCWSPRNAGIKRKRSNRNLQKGRGANRWAGRLTIPKNADPLVKNVFELMNSQRRMIVDIAARSGVTRSTISSWRYDRQPTVANLRAVVNTLGYELVLQKRDET